MKKKTMPSAVPMSTPTPPSMPPQGPQPGMTMGTTPMQPQATVPVAPSGGKHNPDNMLGAGAFHKPGSR